MSIERAAEKPVSDKRNNNFKEYNRIKRRRFVAAAAIGVLAAKGFSIVDGVISREIWKSDKTTMSSLPFEGESPQSAWTVFHGLDKVGGEDLARQLSGASNRDQLWGYYTYDNEKGITIDNLADNLEQFKKQEQFDRLNIFGQSMGALVGLEAAKEKKIPLGVIFLNSSPFDIDDAKSNWLPKTLTGLSYKGDIIGKMAHQTFEDVFHKRFGLKDLIGLGPINKSIDITKESTKEISPMLLMSQLDILNSTDLEKEWKEYRGIISSERTKVVFSAAENPQNDSTVDVRSAYKKWKKFFGHFGVDVTYLSIPAKKHADTMVASRYAENWLK